MLIPKAAVSQQTQPDQAKQSLQDQLRLILQQGLQSQKLKAASFGTLSLETRKPQLAEQEGHEMGKEQEEGWASQARILSSNSVMRGYLEKK